MSKHGIALSPLLPAEAPSSNYTSSNRKSAAEKMKTNDSRTWPCGTAISQGSFRDGVCILMSRTKSKYLSSMSDFKYQEKEITLRFPRKKKKIKGKKNRILGKMELRVEIVPYILLE